MNFEIEVRPLAAFEIVDAFDWYESQKDELGLEFLTSLEEFYSRIRQNPFIYSFYSRQVREGRLNKFPYKILYEVFDSLIVIYSIFMTGQDPEKMRSA